MLHFRESRDGSIDLTGAHPSGLAQLLAGRATRLSSLLRDPEHLADARRRARSIRSKADQLQRQRGIAAAQLAIGFASWNRPKDSGREDFSAPVILRHVHLLPRGSSVDDYEISLSDEIRINPALVDYLRQEHDVIVDVDEWVAATGLAHGFDPAPVFNRLRTLTRPVLGMLVNERLVVSTFANITAPYASESLPAAHPLLRALAGDAEARVGFRLPGHLGGRGHRSGRSGNADSDSTATTDLDATAVSSTASGATDDGVPTERIDMSDPADQGPRPLPDRSVRKCRATSAGGAVICWEQAQLVWNTDQSRTERMYVDYSVVASVLGASWIVIEYVVKIIAVGVVPEDRRPSSSSAWLLLILFVPIVGIPLFLMLGSPYINRRRARIH